MNPPSWGIPVLLVARVLVITALLGARGRSPRSPAGSIPTVVAPSSLVETVRALAPKGARVISDNQEPQWTDHEGPRLDALATLH